MQTKIQQKFERIVDATAYSLNRMGYHGTKTSEIAKSVEITESLLFREFPTKAKLINACLAHCIGTQYVYQAGDFEKIPDGRKFFSIICKNHVDQYFQAPERYAFVFITPHLDFIDEMNKLQKQRLRTASTQMVEEMQRLRFMRKMPLDLILNLFFGAHTRYVRQGMEGHGMPTPKDFALLEEVLWDVFKAG